MHTQCLFPYLYSEHFLSRRKVLPNYHWNMNFYSIVFFPLQYKIQYTEFSTMSNLIRFLLPLLPYLELSLIFFHFVFPLFLSRWLYLPFVHLGFRFLRSFFFYIQFLFLGPLSSHFTSAWSFLLEDFHLFCGVLTTAFACLIILCWNAALQFFSGFYPPVFSANKFDFEFSDFSFILQYPL